MPIKIHDAKLNTRPRQSALLFRRSTAPLYTQVTKISENNLIQGSHFNPWQKIVLRVLDALSPFASKHPKFGTKIIKIGEKMIRSSDGLKSELKNV